jgi:EAL domain-containing protein (putative c-di-GMP-specific phosphodiesterase class I)/GGDEF domain-containing protein
MLKSLLFSIVALFFILFVLYQAVTRFVIKQEVSKARLLAHSLVHTREYLSKFAPYIQFRKKQYFSPFSLTPAYAVGEIAKILSKKDNIYIRQLSDKPRDPKNLAKGDELDAIKYFRLHKNSKDFFIAHRNKDNPHIFYAYPLRMEKSCLKCHGPANKIEKPLYQELVKLYGNKAFGYKLGEIRGIIAIRIPFDQVKSTIKIIFFKLLIVILIVYSIGFYLFLNINSKIINDIMKFNNYFSNTFKKNIYRPFKKDVYFKESKFIKDRINEIVKAIKNYKKDLFNIMYYNQLTGLPNKIRFLEILKRNKAPLILLDIDSFKELNYFYGEKIANEIILQVAQRLKTHKVFHIKIDEFAILKSEVSSKEELFKFTKQLIEKLEEPYYIDDFVIYLKFRAGIAWNQRDFLSLLSALDATKILNKDIVFCKEVKHIRNAYKEHLKWIKKLKSAIKDNKIVTYYQPIVDKNKNICKYEALIGLIDEKGKVITPYYFLDIAKKSKLYFDITKIVLTSALENIKKSKYGISINLSTMDMENESMRKFILEKVKNFDEPSKITFEIIESENIKASKKSIEFIQTLKEIGIQIFIDDFGSGFANFDYLFALGADGIKIDGNLVKNVLVDKRNEVIIKTIVEFAKQFNMKVIAGYVENESIFDKLKELGVECFQGYFYSKPREDIIT